MQYCPHCMKQAAGPKCPNCGGDTGWTGQKGIDLPVGTVLTGGNGLRTYQIGAARGKGGFGITYIALELNSGRRMAVKEYFPTRCAFRGGNKVDVQRVTGQEDAFQRGMNSFLDEGRMLLSQDDLSCVVRVIDYFQANGTAYLVMEYLDGVALHTQMTQMGGRIPVSELMPRLAPLLRDIGQLHQRGVIHRDISPDNIMWMPDGTLKLLDFGSARSMENGKSMTVLMKHGFSPIEQYRSKGQGPYTDIYALAATIYYCVTGVIPPAAMERLDEDGLRSPTALGAALTVDQETALLWALSIQPNARPQSMEEFASMLYKGAPQGPITTGGWTGGGTFMPDRQGQPGGWTGGGTSMPGRQGQPGGWTGGGTSMPDRQGQPGGWTGGGTSMPGQQGQPGGWTGGGTFMPDRQGQPGGWTGGGTFMPDRQGQPGGGGGKSKLPIFIGAGAGVAAVVLLAVIVVNVLNGGKTADSTPSNTPGSWEPTYSVPVDTLPPVPTDEPTIAPTPKTGITDDGFLYEIADQNHAVLTGYEGTYSFDVLPSYIDGIPVTAIADNAFAGAPVDEFIILPMELETIGANAFRGCSDLVNVGAYSDVTTASNSFSGCDKLWFVVSFSNGVSGWNLPSGVGLYYVGMETDYGRLTSDFDMDDEESLLMCETEDGYYVLLDVQSWVYAVDLSWCDRICPWALNNPPYSIELGENTLFPYEMYDSSSVWSAPEGSLADMWLLSCEVANAVNAARPSSAPPIKPDLELLLAASVRAEELAQKYDDVRPNGESWSTVVSDQNIGWAYLGSNYGYRSSWDKIHPNIQEIVANSRAAALTQEEDSKHAGEYFKLIGAAYCPGSDGRYYFQSFVILP